MAKTRIIRVRAITVSSVVVIALLLPALSSARADELTELRAGSQRLQQRLEQIHRVHEPAADAASPAGDPRGAFPRSFLIPGTDTSISIGGSVSESLGYRIR